MFEIVIIMEHNYYFTVRTAITIFKFIIKMRFIKSTKQQFIMVAFTIITITISSSTIVIIGKDCCCFEDRCFDFTTTLANL